jgi:DNA-binding NarL/FixJ family response regulator
MPQRLALVDPLQDDETQQPNAAGSYPEAAADDPPADEEILYLDDAADRRDAVAEERLDKAINLTATALIEVSAAGVTPRVVRIYIDALQELRGLRAAKTARPEPAAPTRAALPALTPRQRAVADLIVKGATTTEIANALDLAPGTVKIHLAAIYRLLGVGSRADAVARLTATPNRDATA